MAGEGDAPEAPLIRAAIDKQEPEHFSDFLRKHPSIVNAGRVDTRTTTLEYACRQPNSDIVVLLLDAGADPNIKKPGFHDSPLSYAVMGGHPIAVFEKLLASGARAQDSKALNEAISRNRADVLELLLHKGADPRIGGHNGKTLLQLAKAQGCDKNVIGALQRAERRSKTPLWKKVLLMDVLLPQY